MAQKSKILIIGGTGNMGKFIVEASVKAGHPTFALVRETALSDPVKAKLVQNFQSLGVTLLYGDLENHEKLVKMLKLVDIVMSAISRSEIPEQFKLIAAIKEAGNIKRFFPSEFGSNVDAGHPIEPAKSGYARKAKIRRAIEAEGIPYTYVSCNCTFGFFLPTLAQPGAVAPPKDNILIYGNGQPKAIFIKEADIASYTIKAVDDPRTLNKTLYLRPPKNIYSFNELVALWEKKIGKTLEKIYVTEDQIIKMIQDANMTDKIMLLVNYSIFMKGEQTNFEIDPSSGVEASELYPDVNYATVDEYLHQLACLSN
ncbi:phenylcoumaran benzylic ether reductase TP7-like [Pistacia vera]|uniref:phenylcoumaran benzylic ether reductase TP7-like n=1 Tax=Pistacia vera TaxID=55513 RepID=UPI001262F55C|nr:phenylcoumaran benzylic ether reductase TP7-like [Pistacia vera]XP_031247519.1 phenylcoumaran benzylic ether reductase TP7-like [Pistacia vera]